jgi:multisubunit Na+/H+ antiporter MnhB subunit
MKLVPVIVVGVIGAVGFVLMVAAFVMVARRGGWQQAMQPDARGHWPAPRQLMLVGALLGTVFGLLLTVPGVIPWWEFTSPYAGWGQGVVFGFIVGFGTGIVYCRALVGRPQNANRSGQGL